MAKTTKKSDLIIKTKLSAKEHQVLKNKVKKASGVAKKAEVQVKLSTKQLAAAEKQLVKVAKVAKKTKTATIKKAKIRAADNVKKAKAKLKQVMQILKDKTDQIKLCESDLVMAERKEAAWQKAAAVFDKQWDRAYDKKMKKASSPAKKVTKKISVRKPVASPKPALALVVPKTESRLPQVNEGMKIPEPVESISTAAVAPEPKPVVYQSAEDSAPLNPLPFPSGFGQTNKDG